MFCGWGAQCAPRDERSGAAPALATQANYDAFLDALEQHGLVPGTIVIDDKWQATYGGNEADAAKWPDLARLDRGAGTRAASRCCSGGRRGIPEGLPAELCVRTPDGVPVALDPTNPGRPASPRAR